MTAQLEKECPVGGVPGQRSRAEAAAVSNPPPVEPTETLPLDERRHVGPDTAATLSLDASSTITTPKGTHELESGQTYLLGRSSSADFQLADPYVSGRHVELTPRGDVLVIRSLKRRNPPELDGRKVDQDVQLSAGSCPATITVGRSALELRYGHHYPGRT